MLGKFLAQRRCSSMQVPSRSSFDSPGKCPSAGRHPEFILPAVQSEPDLSETRETKASGSLSGVGVGGLGFPSRSHSAGGAVDSGWGGGHRRAEGGR